MTAPAPALQKARSRLLRIIARLNVGGPARHVIILEEGLTRAGFETLLAHGDIGAGEASMEAFAASAGIRTRRIAGLGRSINAASDLRAFLTLVRLVFSTQPDVVHTHTAKAGALGRTAAWIYNLTRPRRRRCLIVHTFHGHVLHGYFGPLGSALTRWAERMLATLTDRILVLSPLQKQDLGERYRIAPPSKIRVVPLGLRLDALLGMERRPDGARDHRSSFVFGYVGRFVPIKNLPMLIEAFAKVFGEMPEARLILIGDGETKPDVQALIDSHGLAGAVEFAGWQTDLESVYQRFDALVLSSLNEGTPVAAIEAMAAGLPVVATSVGGVPDILIDGTTGLLVPSGASDELAAAMLRLTRSPELSHKLGVAARESVRQRFSAQRLVADVEQLYSSALQAKRAPAQGQT